MNWLIKFGAQWGIKILGGMLVSALISGGTWLYFKNKETIAYNRGYSQARKDFPQIVNNNNGPITQNTYTDSMGCFPLKLGKFGLGICHAN